MSIRPNWIYLKNETKCLTLIFVFHFLPSFFLGRNRFSWVLLSWSRACFFFSWSLSVSLSWSKACFLYFYSLVFFYEFPPQAAIHLPYLFLFVSDHYWRRGWISCRLSLQVKFFIVTDTKFFPLLLFLFRSFLNLYVNFLMEPLEQPCFHFFCAFFLSIIISWLPTLFRVFDDDHSGKLDFHEYILALNATK